MLASVCYAVIYISPTCTALIAYHILKVIGNAQKGSGLLDNPNHTLTIVLSLMEINKHGSTWLPLVKEVESFRQ